MTFWRDDSSKHSKLRCRRFFLSLIQFVWTFEFEISAFGNAAVSYFFVLPPHKNDVANQIVLCQVFHIITWEQCISPHACIFIDPLVRYCISEYCNARFK